MYLRVWIFRVRVSLPYILLTYFSLFINFSHSISYFISLPFFLTRNSSQLLFVSLLLHSPSCSITLIMNFMTKNMRKYTIMLWMITKVFIMFMLGLFTSLMFSSNNVKTSEHHYVVPLNNCSSTSWTLTKLGSMAHSIS